MNTTKTTNRKPRIKTNDLVKVIAGNYKNKTGKVLSVSPKTNKVVVEGINLLTHYIKPTQKEPKGGMQKKEGPIDLSNLVLVIPDTQQATGITRKKNAEGKLQRYAKKTGNPI